MQVARARHSALFQRFIAALTRGGPGGTPRPIEMHAHDPRRYVGCALSTSRLHVRTSAVLVPEAWNSCFEGQRIDMSTKPVMVRGVFHGLDPGLIAVRCCDAIQLQLTRKHQSFAPELQLEKQRKDAFQATRNHEAGRR